MYKHLLSLKFYVTQARNRFLNIKCMQRTLLLSLAFAHVTHSASCFFKQIENATNVIYIV